MHAHLSGGNHISSYRDCNIGALRNATEALPKKFTYACAPTTSYAGLRAITILIMAQSEITIPSLAVSTGRLPRRLSMSGLKCVRMRRFGRIAGRCGSSERQSR
jgi:hypothetical protein